jgi:hypothetical protein
MNLCLCPGHPALRTPSRAAEMRGHLTTQDSTISRILGSRQNPEKLCAPFPMRHRGQAHGGAAIRELFHVS